MLRGSWIVDDRQHEARLRESYKHHGVLKEESSQEDLTIDLERTLIIDEEITQPAAKRQRLY